MLVPKLPFMKQGERISKFGAGYSKLLNRSPPMSPVPLSNQMMHPSGLMSPQYPGPPAYQQNLDVYHGLVEPATPPNLINQHHESSRASLSNVGILKPRYPGGAAKGNAVKARRDFINMQQEYHTSQMSNAAGK